MIEPATHPVPVRNAGVEVPVEPMVELTNTYALTGLAGALAAVLTL